MAGEEGFEPPHAGTKTRCLTTWPLPNMLVAHPQSGLIQEVLYRELPMLATDVGPQPHKVKTPLMARSLLATNGKTVGATKPPLPDASHPAAPTH